jgi:hypothetical protein
MEALYRGKPVNQLTPEEHKEMMKVRVFLALELPRTMRL